MAYDCRFQATVKDHVPQEYLRYISNEGRSRVQLPEKKQMFVKECMVPALLRNIPPTPTSILMERVKRNGLKHSIFNSAGDLYIGDWKNDKKEGHGTYKTHSGKCMYEGEWVNGKADGYGILCHQGNHKRYNIRHEGFWKNGRPEATGSHHYKNGGYYKGEWNNGVRNGFGKMWYADGTYFEGWFYQNRRHGRGLFVYANGNRYIGDWNANFKHGFGAYYYMNSGQIQMGHWIKDNCVNSWMIDMKFRQTVESPTEFSIPEKAQVVKQFKRGSKSRRLCDRLSPPDRRSKISHEFERPASPRNRRSSIWGSFGNIIDSEDKTDSAPPMREVLVETPRKWVSSTPQDSEAMFWKELSKALS